MGIKIYLNLFQILRPFSRTYTCICFNPSKYEKKNVSFNESSSNLYCPQVTQYLRVEFKFRIKLEGS
jgi:hypothetical protein